jgi:hypothetical protein
MAGTTTSPLAHRFQAILDGRAVLQITGELRHTSYVDNWLKILKGDSKAILTAASLASKATDYLRGFSEPKEQAVAACLIVGPKPKSRTRTTVWCDTNAELDMKTLVWTRGGMMPLERIASLLKCPQCGSREVKVYFEVPNQQQANRAAE